MNLLNRTELTEMNPINSAEATFLAKQCQPYSQQSTLPKSLTLLMVPTLLTTLFLSMSLRRSLVAAKMMQGRKYKRPFSTDYWERGSYARSTYSTHEEEDVKIRIIVEKQHYIWKEEREHEKKSPIQGLTSVEVLTIMPRLILSQIQLK